jgi:ribosomal-protein-alanine N-acetyltransferase
MTKCDIGWPTPIDYDKILILDDLSFEHPWSREEFNQIKKKEDTIILLIKSDNLFAGYLVYEYNRYKFNIVRLAVTPLLRRQKIATMLINKLKSKCGINKLRTKIEVYVSENNTSAHLFFKANDFIATGIIHNHKSSHGEDVYKMIWTKK